MMVRNMDSNLKKDPLEKTEGIEAFLDTMRQQYLSGQLQEEDREDLLFEPFGETANSFRCLFYLLRHKDGVEPSKMADTVRILRQSATGIADQFEKKGYITRHTHPNDRRKILLKITPAGAKVTREMLRAFRDYHNRISAHFTQEEMDAYAQLRSRMHQARDQVIQEILAERKEQDKGAENP